MIRCVANVGGVGAAFRFVACVDPVGRRSANGGLWVNAEGEAANGRTGMGQSRWGEPGFFEQCRIRRPCLYPDESCIFTSTVACEDDKGNKAWSRQPSPSQDESLVLEVPNGTEWLDSTGKFYKRCELHSVQFEEEDRLIVKSYVNDGPSASSTSHHRLPDERDGVLSVLRR